MDGEKNPTADRQDRRKWALRGSLAWFDWVRGLADWRRQSIAQTVDRALCRYAEDTGYHRPQPRRVDRRAKS